MNERTKKILVATGFLLSVFGFGIALYFTFFRPTPPEPTVNPTTGGTGTGTGLPTSGAGTGTGTGGTGTSTTTTGELPEASTVARGGVTVVTELTTSSVEAIGQASDGSSVNFYDPRDGKFYTIDAEGNIVPLSNKSFPNAESVDWNKDGEKAVIEFPDGSNVVYDFASEQQTTLPSHWEEFDFSPVRDEILAKSIALDPNNRYLVVTSDDGSNVKAIQSLSNNEEKVTVSWSPNDQVIAFADTAADAGDGGLARKIIVPVGKSGENYKGLAVEGLGFIPLWSPDGKRLLYSVAGDYSDNKPLLWIVDATASTMGDDRHSLALNTWADKCAFASSSIAYCAVPQNLPVNSGLQRSLADDLPDVLYKIDLNTSGVSLVAIPDSTMSMQNLEVAADGSVLYFQNASTGKLSVIHLK